jgi:hypothetical protein
MIFVVLVALAVATATWLAGWWSVAVVALIAGFVARDRRGRAGHVALGAAIGWALLLLADVAAVRFGALATALGGVFPVPAAALVVLTLLLPALLGWGGAVLGAWLGGVVSRSSRAHNGPEAEPLADVR